MIVALYLPDFPAWAHRRESGTAVAVVHAGRVVAATEDLRLAGLAHGESVNRARRRFPDAAIIDDDPLSTRLARERLLRELYTLTPCISEHFDDFICLELDSMQEAGRLAERLEVRSGYATDDLTASLAAVESSPGQLKVVKPGAAPGFINSRSIRLLKSFGVSDEVLYRLDLFGYGTLERLGRLTRRHWKSQFGDEGTALYDWLNRTPLTRLPMWVPPETASATCSVEMRIREPHEWTPVADVLAERAAENLPGRVASWITVTLDDLEEGPAWSRTSQLKEPTSRAAAIAGGMRRLLAQSSIPSFGRMTVELGGLMDPSAEQLNLFAARRVTDALCRDILRRFPRSLLRYEEGNPHALLPEHRWRLVPLA